MTPVTLADVSRAAHELAQADADMPRTDGAPETVDAYRRVRDELERMIDIDPECAPLSFD